MMCHVYLPHVSSNSMATLPRIGAQIGWSVTTSMKKWIVPKRLYLWPVRWNDCEPNRGVYVWPEYMQQNREWLGQTQIIGTKTSPLWARLWPSNLGSPPKQEFYLDYAKWLCEMIRLYQPWGVELWNEPDCRPEDAAQENFGAWYDGQSWRASGYRYGQFTATVYDYVHQHYPNVKLLVGALMNVVESESVAFLAGAKSGGLRGDYLSYHGYINTEGDYHRIFDLYNTYSGLVSWPIVCTETSMLAHEDSDMLKSLQRDYLQYLIDNVEQSELAYILWYTLSGNGWLNSDLQRGVEPTPAWELFRSYHGN